MAKKGYWITSYRSISDHAALAAYAELAEPVPDTEPDEVEVMELFGD